MMMSMIAIMVMIMILIMIMVMIMIIIIHCTYYQHSDWPRVPAYFENSCDFVDKHDYGMICYPMACADYTARSAHCAPLAKEREHLNGFE